MASNTKLQKTKNANGEISVASSMNSIVKNHFTNMTQQYNMYVSAINEMEEKIKALKSIMLSETFLQNCQNFSLNNEVGTGGFGRAGTEIAPIPKNRESNKNTIMDKTSVETTAEPTAETTAEPTAETSVEPSKEIKYFTPSQSNSLFWCFYIIYKGFAAYEYESNYFTAEQQFKIQTIERVKKGENKSVKSAFKENKISKTYFESGLMGNTNITAKILYALCICYDVNILYIYKNTYYEMITNIEKTTYIIKYNNESNNYSIAILNDMNTEIPNEHKEYIEDIKLKYWKLDNLEKPLRSITTYSVNDLLNICSKLNISVICETTNKKKTKAELYSSILQSL
jgi:hypothetical protein